MRICVIAQSLAGSDGWSQYARSLAREFKADGHEVVVIVQTRDEKSDIKQVELLGAPLSYLANPLRAALSAYRVRRILKTFNPGVVHVTAEPYVSLVPFLPKRYKAVLTVHGTYAYVPAVLPQGLKRSLSKWLYDPAYARVDAIVVPSSYTKKRLLELNHAKGIESRTSVIPNGVDVSVPVSTHERNSEPRILFVGAVKERKGVVEILEGLAAYIKKYGPAHLDIIGALTNSKPYVDKARRLSKELGIDQFVAWRGFVESRELDEAYAHADVFAMLPQEGPEFEGFGLVYLEANARGVPAIGAKGSAADDAIADGKSGLLIDSKDANAFADAVHQVLEKNGPLRASSRAWAEEQSWDMIAEQYERLYEDLDH